MKLEAGFRKNCAEFYETLMPYLKEKTNYDDIPFETRDILQKIHDKLKDVFAQKRLLA